MVCTPELLAWRKIFAFGRNTLEVVRVVLEACCVVREEPYSPKTESAILPVLRLVSVREAG